ncbi:MAG: hypothetical protein ACLT8E_07040 [Akkermansia sp.]
MLVTMGLSTAEVPDKTRMALLPSSGGVFQLLYWVLAFRSKPHLFSLFRIRTSPSASPATSSAAWGEACRT